MLCLILILGASFRLASFDDLTRFNADQVRDAGVIDSMFAGTYPLLGPRAGGTDFHLGPAFYYLEYVSALFFGQNPAGIALLVPLLSIASIALFFFLFRFYFSSSLALILTLLYALSFYSIRYSRFAWNPNVIPFFLFAFFLVVMHILGQNKKHSLLSYALLGVIGGIGMQLHTTLLLLFPGLFLLSQGYLYIIQKKYFTLRGVLLAVGIVIALHTPLFVYEWSHQGENFSSFWEGSEKKTSKNTSLANNALLDVQFFLQGSAYTLTGIEPQKSWLKVPKLFASQNIREIGLFGGGVLFFCAGALLILQRLREENDEKKRQFLLLISGFTVLLFLLFLPIAPELNLRFFIATIFLPFLFLGLLFEYLLKRFRLTGIQSMFLIGVVSTLLVTINLFSFVSIYTLEGNEPESAYGGISLGEATHITQAIKNTAEPLIDKTLFLAPFEFERSIEYLTAKEGLSLHDYSPMENISNSVVFLVIWNEKHEEYLARYACCFNVVRTETLGRFTLLTFESR